MRLGGRGLAPSTAFHEPPTDLPRPSIRYVSAVGACYAARAYLPAMARAYSCFLLWVNLGALETVHFMALSMEASEARPPRRARHDAHAVHLPLDLP